MANTLSFTDTLTIIECCSCGINFGVPEGWQQKRRDDKRDFYCPNGHVQGYYGPNKAEREAAAAKKRAEQLERQLANREEDLRIERAALSATKGQLTKAKRRAAAALCPCCNRSFVQLRRHLDAKHPEYSGEVLADAST